MYAVRLSRSISTLLFFSIQSLVSEVRVIHSITEVLPVLRDLPSDSLVIFDVDETLIVARDKIRRKNPEKVIQEFKKNNFLLAVSDELRREYLRSIALRDAEQMLVELISRDIIKDLQKRKIKVIALTSMETGRYHTIDSMEEWRFQQLYNLGINLNTFSSVVLSNLPKGRVAHPVFYKGILATSRSCSKGEVLVELLKNMGWNPSMIIMFDDYMCHVKDVCEKLEKCDIACVGYHYKFTEINFEKINEKIASFQYKYLIEHEAWISDQKTRERLENE